MFLPSRRWYAVAAGLAVVAPAGLLWPPALALLLGLDLAWILALIIDGLRTASVAEFEMTRTAPPAFSLGRTFPVWYRWSHRRNRPIVVLVREELPAPLSSGPPQVRRLEIPAGQLLIERVDLAPVRRGKAAGGLCTLRVRGPLGLIWRQGRIERPWTATVFPSLIGASLRALPTRDQRRREAGFRNLRRVGEGRLFESLKEWVPGEDTRTIDWKATARRGKVMARQYEDERRQQVLIVVDAGRLLTAEVDGVPRLEAVVNAALRLAYSAVEHDDDVGIMVFADQVQQFVPPARGRRALRAVLEVLAAVEGRLVEPDYPAAFAYLAARNRKRALTVIFTDVIDRTASDALVAMAGTLRPRHLPLAVTLRDPMLERIASTRPDTVGQAYQRAAAEELLQSRAEALAEMRGRGVLVLDVAPKNAGGAVVEQYGRLKRRGML